MRCGAYNHPESSGCVGLVRTHRLTATQDIPPARWTRSSYGPPCPFGRWSSKYSMDQLDLSVSVGFSATTTSRRVCPTLRPELKKSALRMWQSSVFFFSPELALFISKSPFVPITRFYPQQAWWRRGNRLKLLIVSYQRVRNRCRRPRHSLP